MIDPRDDLAWRRERNAEFKAFIAQYAREMFARAFSARPDEIADLVLADMPRAELLALAEAGLAAKPSRPSSGEGAKAAGTPSKANDARGRGLKGEGA